MESPQAAEIVYYEEKRYKTKGYGLLVACITTFCFFYFVPKLGPTIWPVLREITDSDLNLFCLLAYLSTIVFTVVKNLEMWAIYHVELPFFERYKVNNKPWPWVSDRQAWNKMLWKTLPTIFFNIGIFAPVIIYGDMWAAGVKTRMDNDSLPSSLEVMWQVAFCMFIEDLLFYASHRILHHPATYPHVHKKHHEYKVTVGIAAGYCTPIEHFFSNMAPSGIGAKLLGSRMHFYTFMIWLLVRVAESTDGHCGYEFSWSPYRLLPFSGSADYHDFHHMSNTGNFSSFFSIWDTVFGTNTTYYNFMKKREAALKDSKKIE